MFTFERKKSLQIAFLKSELLDYCTFSLFTEHVKAIKIFSKQKYFFYAFT